MYKKVNFTPSFVFARTSLISRLVIQNCSLCVEQTRNVLWKRDLYVFNFNVVESVIDQYVLTLIHKIIDTHSDNPNTVPDFVRVSKYFSSSPVFSIPFTMCN